MLCSTRAIVLHQIKYRESSLVLHLYTREFGRISGIVGNVFGKKSTLKANIFQPLYLTELQLYYMAGRDLHRIKDGRIQHAFTTIPQDIKKSSVTLFLAEVLYKTLKEESPNCDLFDFISHFMVIFDEDTSGNQNLHLWFLMQLIRFLGFSPGSKPGSGSMFFDIKNAKYCTSPPAHAFHLKPELTDWWSRILMPGMPSSAMVPQAFRRDLLEAVLTFYKLHIDGFSDLKSYPILKEIFK